MLNSGFGYTRNSEGILIRKVHNGIIIYGDDVEIGINTVIDRGSYRDTIIGDGTKIDNLVHVGHNVHIGKHCLIVAGCVLGGSSEIGDYSYIGMNCSVQDHVKIGKHCIIGSHSNIIKDVEDYDIVAGSPAISIKSKVTLTDNERFNMAGY